MDSLLTNLTQSQQIPDYLHHLYQKPPTQLQNAQSYLNVHIQSETSFSHFDHKKPYLLDRTISHSTLNYPRTQNVKSFSGMTEGKFQQQFMAFNHHQKINCLLDVIRMYRKFVAERGLFLLNINCLKIDCIGRAVLWINTDHTKTQPSLFLNSSKYNQWRVVQSLIDLFRKYFSDLFFKYAKIRSLEDLENFFSSVKKRNQIHKRCKCIMRQMSRSKVRTSISARTITPDASASKKFDLKERPSSYFGAIKPKSNLSISMSSKHFLSFTQKKGDNNKQNLDNGRKSELDTTTNISCSVLRQNKSYLQSQNFGVRSDAKIKSCVVNPAQNQNSLCNYAKKTSMVANDKQILMELSPLDEKENKKIIESIQLNRQEKQGKEMKGSLQICFQGLFLSEIVEDTESEILNSGTDGKMQQFMKDFQNVFY